MMAFAHHGINSVYTWMKIINPCSQRRRKSNRSVAYNFDSFFIRKSRIRKKLFRVKILFCFFKYSFNSLATFVTLRMQLGNPESL